MTVSFFAQEAAKVAGHHLRRRLALRTKQAPVLVLLRLGRKKAARLVKTIVAVRENEVEEEVAAEITGEEEERRAVGDEGRDLRERNKNNTSRTQTISRAVTETSSPMRSFVLTTIRVAIPSRKSIAWFS